MRPDYYQLLDVPESATAAEIKLAYRRQAKRYHPDHNEGNDAAEERFKAVAEAYRVLSDADERAYYDRWLTLQKRLSQAPELAQMPRRVRVSVRHGQERRGRRRSRSAMDDVFIPRMRHMRMLPSWSFSRWHLLFIYLVAFSVMMPWVLRFSGCNAEDAAARRQKHERAMLESIRERAFNGEPLAQYRYGNILYFGSCGVEPDAYNAMLWWQRAAAQGHEGAAHNYAQVWNNLSENLEGLPPNIQKAILHWYEQLLRKEPAAEPPAQEP